MAKLLLGKPTLHIEYQASQIYNCLSELLKTEGYIDCKKKYGLARLGT